MSDPKATETTAKATDERTESRPTDERRPGVAPAGKKPSPPRCN